MKRRGYFPRFVTLLLSLAIIQITPFANSAAPSSASTSGNLISGVNNYPPSRFQPGRPSLITGLKVVASVATNRTVTLKWNLSPAAQSVESYAIYYQGMVSAPNPVDFGVLAGVVSKNTATLSLVGLAGNSDPHNPYGQNQIPICISTYCQGIAGGETNIWVIAHNKFGWGDNSPFAANPDENPINFSPLSDNQIKVLKTPKIFKLDLKNLDPRFLTLTWPAPSQYADYLDLSRPTDVISSEKDAVGSAWTVPWLPNKFLPLSRFGPGRPTNVAGFQVVKLNLKTKQISFRWNPNPTSENVDSYALYLNFPACPDDTCTSWLVGVVKSNSLLLQLRFGSMPLGNPFGRVSDGKTLTIKPLDRSYGFWVIAHNKFGWSDNVGQTPNPDQEDGDFRTLSWSQAKLPTTAMTITYAQASVPCSVLLTAQQNNC